MIYLEHPDRFNALLEGLLEEIPAVSEAGG